MCAVNIGLVIGLALYTAEAFTKEPSHAPTTAPTHKPTSDPCSTDGEIKFVIHMSDSWCVTDTFTSVYKFSRYPLCTVCALFLTFRTPHIVSMVIGPFKG